MSSKFFKLPTAQFLVEIELDVRAVVTATLHFVPLTDRESVFFNVFERAARSFARALPNRDMTVPTGQSKTLATFPSPASRARRFPVLSPLLLRGCGSRPVRSCTIRRDTRHHWHPLGLFRRGSMTYLFTL